MRLSVPLLTTLLTTPLTACWSSPSGEADAGFSAEPALHVPGGAPVLDLRRLPASLDLPDAPEAPGGDPAARAPASTVFNLTGAEPATGRIAERVRASWQLELPFELGPDAERLPPPGMKVRIVGRELPWLLRARAHEGWRVGEQGQLLLAVDAPPGEVVVEHPGLVEHLARLDPRRSGLSPTEYMRYALSLEQDTREGLILPAGATATWDLSLPAGPSLHTALGLVDDRLRGGASGLQAEVIVRHGGEEHRLQTRAIEAGSGFAAWQVGLSRWSGEQVQLSLRCSGSASADVCFFAHPEVIGAAEPQAPLPRRVVWIGLDTTRKDRLGLYGYGRPTSPQLDAWSRSAQVFDAAITPAPRTRPSFRSALTGRRPLDAVGQPTFLARLDEAGFATAGIVANVHLNSRFGFPAGADRWSLDPSAKATAQVDDALAWLEANADRDAALFLHLMDPHLPYVPPAAQAQRFVRDPVSLPSRFSRGDVYGWMREGSLDDRGKAHISDLYDAEIATTDEALGRLLARLDSLPGRTVVIVHSDHGEELWEHGSFEHNHSLKPELHDAVMLLRAPGLEAARRPEPVALMDLVPTLLALLGLPADDELDGVSLLDEIPRERALDLGHLMYERERWGVRQGGHSYVLWTGSGREALFDRARDPGEHDNIVETASEARKSELRQALGQVHGAQVGPGWRVHLATEGALLALDLPAPAVDAGVIDPERERRHRANQAWGELPSVRPDQVASLSLSEDRRRLLIRPGAVGEGTLWIRFEAPTPVSGLLRAGGEQVELVDGQRVQVPGVPRLEVRAGTVILPPPDEAARMRALGGDAGAVDATEREVLRALGYLRDTDEAQ